MKKLLEFKNLVTEFHTEGNVVKAVNNVSFTLNKGETVGGKCFRKWYSANMFFSPENILTLDQLAKEKN